MKHSNNERMIKIIVLSERHYYVITSFILRLKMQYWWENSFGRHSKLNSENLTDDKEFVAQFIKSAINVTHLASGY